MNCALARSEISLSTVGEPPTNPIRLTCELLIRCFDLAAVGMTVGVIDRKRVATSFPQFWNNLRTRGPIPKENLVTRIVTKIEFVREGCRTRAPDLPRLATSQPPNIFPKVWLRTRADGSHGLPHAAAALVAAAVATVVSGELIPSAERDGQFV